MDPGVQSMKWAVTMPRTTRDDKPLDLLALQNELAIRRAKRMVEWMRTVYANESALLRQTTYPEEATESRESHPTQEPDQEDRSTSLEKRCA
jgi:hypothetical protein